MHGLDSRAAHMIVVLNWAGVVHVFGRLGVRGGLEACHRFTADSPA